MKFAKLKKSFVGYMQYEQNSEVISLIALFLYEDVYKYSKSYLDWLKSISLPSDEGGYGGEQGTLQPAGDVINLIPNWTLFDEEDLTPEDLALQYSFTKEELVELIKKWDVLIHKEQIPENIAVIQNNNNKIHIEAVSNDDPRFSRIIIDKTGRSFAKIQKSKIFEDYYQVEANTHSYLSLGMLFSQYITRKADILEWLYSKDEEKKFYFTNYGTFFKKNEIVCLSIKLDTVLEHYKFCYPMNLSNLLELFEQWEQILKKEPFPKEVLIYEENGKMVMEERN